MEKRVEEKEEIVIDGARGSRGSVREGGDLRLDSVFVKVSMKNRSPSISKMDIIILARESSSCKHIISPGRQHNSTLHVEDTDCISTWDS